MNDKILTIEEVQCLVWHGLSSRQIKAIDLDSFDKLYDENPDDFDAWLEKAEKMFDKEYKLGIRIPSIQDEEYPQSLRAIGDDAPSLIHLLGDTSLLKSTDSVAVIGARAADRDGLSAAYSLGKRYASDGKVVVSGLALGCDRAAHEGCLDAGGKTIAVVASGLDITHPSENKPLQDRILANGGLLLSEQLLGVKANPTRLIARNRLQAALSSEVILAQCPEHSGSMHTMRFARKYRKKCYAVEFPRYTEINGGNKLLIESNQALPLKP
ncbi:MAG: DNA-protecting protein DprA [Muribaculum sp.]|nr:DNA-protecting protein DprA [Muribaculum sp.]